MHANVLICRARDHTLWPYKLAISILHDLVILDIQCSHDIPYDLPVYRDVGASEITEKILLTIKKGAIFSFKWNADQ